MSNTDLHLMNAPVPSAGPANDQPMNVLQYDQHCKAVSSHLHCPALNWLVDGQNDIQAELQACRMLMQCCKASVHAYAACNVVQCNFDQSGALLVNFLVC